ncbi:MAG: hypothetical protein R2798_13000 [Chitinophagales bacterium]|nr:hypothetical protein [Bacteroidota bacterium]
MKNIITILLIILFEACTPKIIIDPPISECPTYINVVCKNRKKTTKIPAFIKVPDFSYRYYIQEKKGKPLLPIYYEGNPPFFSKKIALIEQFDTSNTGSERKIIARYYRYKRNKWIKENIMEERTSISILQKSNTYATDTEAIYNLVKNKYHEFYYRKYFYEEK